MAQTSYLAKADIHGLVAYLPKFCSEGYVPINSKLGDCTFQSDEKLIVSPDYKPEVIEFYKLIAQECWLDHEYDPVEVQEILNQPAGIEKSTLNTIKKLLTYCWRGERFCDGHWGLMITSGIVCRILIRLIEIEKHLL